MNVKSDLFILAACALAISVLLADAAGAQAATDVDCNLCVNNSDLANNSVTSGRIVDGTIRTDDLAPGAVTTATLKNRAVSFGKLSTGVRDALDGAIANLTTVAVEDAATGIAEASCPSGRIPVSASCLCDDANGSRNFGVLFACAVDGNGAVAACFDEGRTFNAAKPSPLAIVQANCLGAESTDGTPWVPTSAGLARYSPSAGDDPAAALREAEWQQTQHQALVTRVNELRARRERHRSLLLD